MKRAATATAAFVVALAATWNAGSVTMKDEGPTAIAVAYGSVWVADASGHVTRFDPATRRPVSRHRLGHFVRALASAGGSIWASSDRGVFRLNAATGQPRSAGVSASGVTAIAARRGTVWFGSSSADRVLRYDVARARVRAAVQLRGRFWGMRAGQAGVWVQTVLTRGPVTEAGRRAIARIDERTNRLTRTAFTTACDSIFAVDRAVVWVADSCRRTLRRIRATTARQVGAAIPLESAPIAIAVGFADVWVATTTGPVVRFDGGSGNVEAAIDVPGAIALTSGADAVWVATRAGRVTAIDPETNRATTQ